MSTDCCADPAATLDTVTQPFDPSALFGGGQGGENPMAGLLAQAQQMQEKLLAAQDEIASAEIVGSAGNGLVAVTGNGTGEVTKVSIDPKIVDPDDVETLQDLLLGALEDLSRKRERLTSEKMGPLAGGLGGGIPGLGG
ncbi:YbaB/EbfC family nucleoid-associated protein [Gordonia paraffinivorans]|uniref:YbaB/EbfC family nucleoid-associated protein n=1 Tax=Gordonia paraffinivorans TaxID=175628 RepID=UPI001B357DE1|nr:YbaB/EbfC family nucleoid-associated protein [Gordonia paraffinivorans]